MKELQLPRLYKQVQGAIGKKYVIKHYGKKIVVTKFPDMSKLIATQKQVEQRNLFKEAVGYAKKVIADPVEKSAWQKKITGGGKLFQGIIKEYLLVLSLEMDGRLLTKQAQRMLE